MSHHDWLWRHKLDIPNLTFPYSKFDYSTIQINLQRLVSRRSLRHDPIFDALIAKLYPSREVYEKEQDDLLNQVINKHQGQMKEKRPKKPAVRRPVEGEFSGYSRILTLSGNSCRFPGTSRMFQILILDDRTVENGKSAPVGAKRPYPIETQEELHIVLVGRTPERNKQIIIKCENENEMPKVGHIKCKYPLKITSMYIWL